MNTDNLQNKQKNQNILAIDWGKKRLGLAYNTYNNSVIFPIGSLDNDDIVLYNIAHLVVQYGINKIIVGSPHSQDDVKDKIDLFIKNISFVISSDCQIEKVNEDYSSVQANAQLGIYKKTAAEDSLAAAYILEEYRRKENM